MARFFTHNVRIELTLTLLVTRFSANYTNRAIAPNNLAVTAHFLYRSSNFHRSLQMLYRGGSARQTAATVALQVRFLHHRLVLV